jgi:hypothetical protein
MPGGVAALVGSTHTTHPTTPNHVLHPVPPPASIAAAVSTISAAAPVAFQCQYHQQHRLFSPCTGYLPISPWPVHRLRIALLYLTHVSPCHILPMQPSSHSGGIALWRHMLLACGAPPVQTAYLLQGSIPKLTPKPKLVQASRHRKCMWIRAVH